MASAPSSTASVRTAPLGLWRAAAAFLRTLHVLFGAPGDVAARGLLTPRAHAQIASWLRCAEALMRRLLLIEAAAFPAPAAARRGALHKATPRAGPRAIAFRCFAGAGGRGARTPLAPRLSADELWAAFYLAREAPPKAPSLPAGALAARYEAVLRVFEAPAPFARRLARRLWPARHRLREPLRAPPEAGHRIVEFAALGERGRALWRAPHFSSA